MTSSYQPDQAQRHLPREANGESPDSASPSRLMQVKAWTEQHPLLAVAALALAVRGAVALAIAVAAGGTLFPDDLTYVQMAAAVISGEARQWDDYTHWLYWQTATFMVPVTFVARLLGSATVAGQLVAVAYGTTTAVITTRVAMEVLPPKRAAFAGVIVALLPSQVLWSSLTLKDAAVWALFAALALVVTLASKQHTWRALVSCGGFAVVLLFLMGHVRMHSLIIAAWAVALAAWTGGTALRVARGAGAAVILILIPYLAGAGPAGLSTVTGAGSLEERRMANAAGAVTAIVPTEAPGGPSAESPARTPDSPLSDDDAALNPNLAHLPRGISVMLFEPYPWQWERSFGTRLAGIETLVWYPLIILALFGSWESRRRLNVVLFPLLAGGGSLLTYALAEGNFGTAFRHRGELVWVVALFAALGFSELAQRVASRRSRT